MSLDFTWDGAAQGNSARATGLITFNDGLPQNPATALVIYQSVLGDIAALTITVTGASAGNGTFTLADFPPTQTSLWNTGGITLDLFQELAGQTDGVNTWMSNAGDFNNIVLQLIALGTLPANEAAAQLIVDAAEGRVTLRVLRAWPRWGSPPGSLSRTQLDIRALRLGPS